MRMTIDQTKGQDNDKQTDQLNLHFDGYNLENAKKKNLVFQIFKIQNRMNFQAKCHFFI